MKTFSQSATTTERPVFIARDASGVVTCRNPKGIYPETFKIAPIWFFEPERIAFKQKKVF